MKEKKTILVICTKNSCRSPIAHGFLEYFSGGQINVYSAGLEASQVHPEAIKTIAEIGIDIQHYTSNNIAEYKDIKFDFVITVCDEAAEKCPHFWGKDTQKIHFGFKDPCKNKTPQSLIEIRDKIATFCRNFIKEYIATNP